MGSTSTSLLLRLGGGGRAGEGAFTVGTHVPRHTDERPMHAGILYRVVPRFPTPGSPFGFGSSVFRGKRRFAVDVGDWLWEIMRAREATAIGGLAVCGGRLFEM